MMTTREAFEELINTPEWFRLCGITSQQARNIKKNHKAGHVTEEKMKAVLISAGYSFNPEKWVKTKRPVKPG